MLWGFRVGAAALVEDDKIYGGCYVESWVSGLGICAERCAINHAVLHGNRKIKEIATVADADSQRARMVEKKYFELYRFGRKDVELRAVKRQWKNSKPRAIATIQCGRRALRKRITRFIGER